MITREQLDKLVEKYETKEFIKDDPIQFPHRGKTKAEIELYGFIASLFSYGSRKVFIKKLDEIFKKAEGDLVGFIKNGDFSSLKGVDYRFSKENDIIPIFTTLSKIYNESKGLEELFEAGFTTSCELQAYQEFLYSVVNYFYSNAPKTVGQGFYHMIPNPRNGGAMKRMNMFLRWMVRSSQVDLGVWDCLKPKDLLIPLDVHVARVSREMGLLKRKSNDFNALWELMEHLRKFCPDDPVKYDFAMFAFGIELKKNN
jgi:uncharacterized protein (TIGR02757 family)